MTRTKGKKKLSGPGEISQWLEARKAKKPTPEQKDLLELVSTIEQLLYEGETDFDSLESLESEEDLYHIYVDTEGRTCLTVTQTRNVDLPLDDLCGDQEQIDRIEAAIQRHIPRTRAKPLRKSAGV